MTQEEFDAALKEMFGDAIVSWAPPEDSARETQILEVRFFNYTADQKALITKKLDRMEETGKADSPE